MANERDNTVPSSCQLPDDERMRGSGDGSPRILFLGNSVTLHAPKADIGWHSDWGMAASAEEKDYVHVFMEEYRKSYPNAAWRIGQLACWERAFWTDEEVLGDFAALRNWNADIIIAVILGANTPSEELANHDYAEHYTKMLRYFNPNGTAKLIVTDMFWENPAKDEAVRRAAEMTGATLVGMNDLGRTDEMMAFGLFEHRGVAMHPGDLGMRTMAERLLKAAL